MGFSMLKMGKSKPVGSGYMLMRTEKDVLTGNTASETIVFPSGFSDGTKPQIDAEVVQIAWDTRYVLAKQHDGVCIQYLILDTLMPKLYGGYSFDEFQHKREELNISNNLVLKNVDEIF